MSNEEIEKILMENALAIRELTTISSNTSRDIDRMVGHIEELIPIHTRVNGIENRLENLEEESRKGVRPETMKNLLKTALVIIIGFGSWITLLHFDLDKKFAVHEEENKSSQKTISQEIKKNDEKSNDNKNQITYLKGRIK